MLIGAVLIVAVLVALLERRDESTPSRTTVADGTTIRMVGRPVLFRFIGPQPSRVGGVETPRLSYTIIFRLNRDAKQLGDPDPRDVDPRVSATSRGDYKLANDIIFAADAPIFTLGRRSTKHCFHGVLPDGEYPDLDRLPAGASVRFVAQPLTASSGGKKLGQRFVTRPRIMLTDIGFRRRSARRALARLGCLTSALQEYGHPSQLRDGSSPEAP